MSEPQHWRIYWRAPVTDRVLLGLTLVLTVVTDLTVAIGTGVALGLALRWWQGRYPQKPPTVLLTGNIYGNSFL